MTHDDGDTPRQERKERAKKRRKSPKACKRAKGRTTMMPSNYGLDMMRG